MDEELQDFRGWVRSLSHEDLLCALEFDFTEDNDGSSHEYELLKEMVRLQSPPGTPIHPRAMSFRQATKLGANDGRNEEERVRKNRFTRPRLFQLLEKETAAPRLNRSRRRIASKRFDVFAKKFATPSGDVHSLGCTQEQRDADEALLKGTRVHHDKGRDRCILCLGETLDKERILRILLVSSRGKFMTVPTPKSPSIPFCAPWMSVDQWFSLPMYLASRFEVALMTAYRRHPTIQSSWIEPIRDVIQRLPEDAVRRAVLSATAKSLSEDILKSDSVEMIRDGCIWHLLDARSDIIHSDVPPSLLDLGTIAIIDLGSPKHTLQSAVWRRLEIVIALESEKEVLRSLNGMMEPSRTGAAAKPKRKKGKKKKRRKESTPLPTSNVLNSDAPEDQAEEAAASTSNGQSEPILQFRAMDPESIEQAKENTRKLIMIGSIIDGIVDAALDRLGLNPPTPEPSRDDKQHVSNNGHTTISVLEVKSQNRSITDKGVSEPVVTHPEKLTEVKAESVGSEYPPSRPTEPENTNDLEPSFRNSPAHTDLQWNFEETFDAWENVKRFPGREKSLLADLFLSQQRSDTSAFVASSTAASIASSYDNESGDDGSMKDEKTDEDVEITAAASAPVPPVVEEAVLEAVAAAVDEPLTILRSKESSPERFSRPAIVEEQEEGQFPDTEEGADARQSPSPNAPKTPPPQLSPLLVSLADLQTIRTRTTTEIVESPKARSFSEIVAGSLPSSPMPSSKVTLAPSWSRDDLRTSSFTDDHRLQPRKRKSVPQKQADALLSYRNLAAKSVINDARSVDTALRAPKFGVQHELFVPHLGSNASRKEREMCAQSETAVDALSYEMPLNDSVKGVARDNSEVSVSTKERLSPNSSRGLPGLEELDSLREERNAFRDMCLTLGAEVSKLKNLLAAQSGATSHAPVTGGMPRPIMNESSYDPEFIPPFFNAVPKATTVGAMSDVGTHRGDHDSAVSEDGTDFIGYDNAGRPRAVHVRRMSSGVTIAGSDLSVEQSTNGPAIPGFRSLSRDAINSLAGHGLHSRLTKDILSFLSSKSSALKNQDSRKTAAIERMTRLVTALWPRAQVKIYGSHVTGLCLPSSDLDFVITLPAVHKNAPAVAPGVLEGRNAINESSQKLLARKLKGESWIDPRSIKIIERTVVPVIKVSTKDSRSRVIQLDISFDGPQHHGLAAIQMITDVMEEYPMIQPLVLVLKQFLLDRGLLTAYTGGLSSYCLFLMVTRYLQEHPSSWGDCGSLLMGFLDFYGNSFDPRATGISVKRRQYFARLKYAQPQQMWNAGFPQHHTPSSSSSVGGRPDLIRRNSFNENATMEGIRGGASPASTGMHASLGSRPPRFQASPSHQRFQHQYPSPQGTPVPVDHAGRPYTFDPLFVEDPLAEGNNVGRNAFRIFQVQRAFSDAHRALIASLEWDIHSSHDDGEYPLLNCLLQSEDVFYEI